MTDPSKPLSAPADQEPVRGEPRVPPGLSLESDIRRDRSGRWFHDGAPVEHPNVIRCFDAWIDRHENGRYVLKNEVNWAFVEVEGAPVFVRRASMVDDGVELELSDGRRERLAPATLRQDQSGVLYCQVRHGRLTAQFSRQAMFDLEPALDEDEEGPWVQVGSKRIRPAVTASPIQ